MPIAILCACALRLENRNYVSELHTFFSHLEPTPTRIRHIDAYLDPKLSDCTHVYILSPAFKIGLNPCYRGPFEVVAKHDHHFDVSVSGKVKHISLDNLKPAVLGEAPGKTDTGNRNSTKYSTNVAGDTATRASDQPSLPDHNGLISVSRSRAGRPIRQPDALQDYTLFTFFNSL